MTQDGDNLLDALRAALDVAPSPEFRARVRVAVGTDVASPSWRPWVVATAGAILVAMGVAGVWRHVSLSEAAAPVTTAALAVPMVPAGESPRAPLAATVGEAGRRHAPRARVAGPVAARTLVEPEVLVPPGQLQLLLAYADARRASVEIETDHVAAPVIDVLVPEAIEVVAAPMVDVIKG